MFNWITQGSAFLATAGLSDVAPLGQTSLTELDALQVEMDVPEEIAFFPPIFDARLKENL